MRSTCSFSAWAACPSTSEPIVKDRRAAHLLHYTDPLPQALVLTAIVIGFAMTALFLVVLLARAACLAPTMSTAGSPKE
jgi:multicomponent K+:H+ antiporter subunit C